MVSVEHARHTVEPEAVKVVLVHPESEVAQQEAHDFMMTIVEQSAVPELMSSLWALVEVLMVSSIKLIQTIEHVLGSMTVNNIQQDNKAQAVSSVYQLLEVLRRSVSTAGSEEVVDLVAKTGVVRMFHDGHKLDGIVSQVFDTREHALGEFLIGRHSKFRGRDSNMSLIHPQAFRSLRPRMLESVLL